MSGILKFFVNGKLHVISSNSESQHYKYGAVVVVDNLPKLTLIQYLRTRGKDSFSGLTGTKLGCGEGGCGACTVMLSYHDSDLKTIVHRSANACLTPICALDGFAVTTIEGIGGLSAGLHPIQRRIASMHGSQCGFCTPGIVMSIYSFLRANPNATPHEIEESLDGNLCRCTGYRPIIEAAVSLSSRKNAIDKAITGCCGGSSSGGCPCFNSDAEAGPGTQEKKCCHSEENVASQLSVEEEMAASGLTEPIFPPSLHDYEPRSLAIEDGGVAWYQPITLDELLTYKALYPRAKLVVGNTEVGIEVKYKAMEYAVLINPGKVRELLVLEVGSVSGVRGVIAGAAVTINSLRQFISALESGYKGKEAYLIRGLCAIRSMLTWFASNQIRNVACIGGNIVTASPISDLNPMLLTCGASLTITRRTDDLTTRRVLPIKEFFLSYRRVDLADDEILESVFIPFTSEFEFVVPFKQARRREDDISIVTCGMRYLLAPSAAGDVNPTWTISSCSLAFGGMAPTTVAATKTAAELETRAWTVGTIEEAFISLRKELSLPENVPGGQAEYRMSLAVSFLFKSYFVVTNELAKYLASSSLDGLLPALPALPIEDVSAAENFVTTEKTASRGEQHFSSTIPGRGIVGQSLQHKNADHQVSGETKYTGDMPLPADAVHACLVTSTRAHAKIVNIDLSIAEKCPGYVQFFSAKDIKGSNHIGAIAKDEEVFAVDTVTYFGAVIGLVVASTHEQAVYAARKVVIEYADISPVIISIEDAIANQSFFPDTHSIETGDMGAARLEAECHVTGSGRVGGQEHFYLETNCTIALPTDAGCLEIYSSTQNPTKTQNFCASVCGIPANKVTAKCKRMGGGFGGKETRSVFIAVTAALAAHILQRPVSINVERDVDMSITGQRHAFYFTYSAGCSKDGMLKYFDAHLYNNAGFSLDLSQPIMDRALLHCDNVYKYPAFRAVGTVCRTNLPSHTAFRGFGGPQGLMLAEMVIEHLASESGVPADVIRQQNIYREGDRTHFGETLVDFNVPDLWRQIQTIGSVQQRREEVAAFNATNKWRKRGLSVLPTKFGINFTAKFMNQGGALVHVYTDGSVLISHGGTEMGQGLHTKIIQIAAQKFGIADSMVEVVETATNVVANGQPTAASMSTDLYGMAVLDACEQILSRLQPIREQLRIQLNLDATTEVQWETLISTAFFNRVNLSAQGFYIVPTDRCGFDWNIPCPDGDNSKRGMPFNYFTQGVACSEVEIDCLTGDSFVRRVDILMDIGKPINPAIDIGQIEGAFVQGYGWCTMEELVWGDKDHPWVRPGQLFTRGPGTYKIPSFNDVPRDFRVHLYNKDNKFAVHSSKAVGEPPFFLGCSVFFAIQEAVNAARQSHHGDAARGFSLDLPATSERIRMGCADPITSISCESVNATEEQKKNTGIANHIAYRPKGSWMSALQYFDLFDEILVNQTNERGFVENNYDSKTIMFMELISYKGRLQRELLYFLSWLISNNDRELYFSAQCNIKFIHMQSSLELLKVTIFINSRCLVHRRLNEWTGRILISWQRNCEKRNLQKLTQIGGGVEKSYWGYFDDNFIVSNTNQITELENSMKDSYLDSPRQRSSDDNSGQNSTNRDEECNNLETLPAEEVPAVIRKSVSFHSSQIIGAGMNSVAHVSKGQELVNDVYGMLEAVEAKVLKLKSIYSEGLVDNLSVGRVLHELRGLTVEESDGIRPSKRLEKAIFYAKQQIESIESSAAHIKKGPQDPPSSYLIKEQESDWDLLQFQQIATTNEDRSQNATTVESTESSISSTGPTRAIMVKNNIPFQKSQSSPALKDESSLVVGKVQSTPVLTVATMSKNKSFSYGSNADVNSIRGVKEQHPFFLNQTPHVKEQQPSSDGLDYHYIMNRVQSSDSISSLGATSVDIKESQAVYLDVDNESLTTSGNEDRTANLSQRPTIARRRSSNIDFSTLPCDSIELIAIFNIQLRSVFDGELVAKKSSSDYMFKKRYLWINPSTRSIHWGKSLSQKERSKFFMLTRSRVGKRPIGHIKGVVHSVEFGPMGISICTESSQCLELKLPPASVKDWKRVFLALI